MWLLFGLIIKFAPAFRIAREFKSFFLSLVSWLVSILLKEGDTEDNLDDDGEDESEDWSTPESLSLFVSPVISGLVDSDESSFVSKTKCLMAAMFGSVGAIFCWPSDFVLRKISYGI